MNKHFSLNFLIGTAALFIILACIKFSAAFIVPILIALFIVIICSPVINFLTRRKVPHILAIGVLSLALIAILVFLGGLISSSVTEFSQSLPQYEGLFLARIDQLNALATKFNLPFDLNTNAIAEHINARSIFNVVANVMGNMSNVLSSFFTLSLLIVFMLFESKNFKYKLSHVLNKSNNKTFTADNISLILDSVIQYLGLKAFVSLLTGVCVWGLLKVLGVQYAVLWATLCFLLNFVPNIGSLIASIPVIIQAFLLNTPTVGAITAFGLFAINMIIGNILEPRVMGKNLGLSTLVVFLSLLFWGWLLGTVGMLLSVPLTMIVKIVLESSPNTAHYAVLLGDDDKDKLAKMEKSAV